MPKVPKELTDKEVKALKPKLGPNREEQWVFQAVGGVPYLYFRWKDNTKSWVFYYPYKGKRKSMGLGSARSVTLKGARAEARFWLEVLARGEDPVTVRQSRRKKGLDEEGKRIAFKVFAEQALKVKTNSLTNAKSINQHFNTFRDYVYPVIGNMKVPDIETKDVYEVLAPIWQTKNPTATRLRERLEWVFDNWANRPPKTKGFENPAALRRNLDTLLPKVIHKPDHFEAIPWQEAPEMYRAICKINIPSAHALQMIMLHIGRVGEVGYMRWDEVDLTEGIWTVPAERMKNRKPFVEPLTTQARRLIGSLPRVDDLVFKEKGVSETALRKLHMKSGFPGTRHGFRSTFTDFILEKTSFPEYLVKLCKSHSKTALEEAYQRSDLREKRREVMQVWANYLEKGVIEP